MAADVFESYEVTLVAAIISGRCNPGDSVNFAATYGDSASAFALKLILFPSIDSRGRRFASILGTHERAVKPGEQDPMKPDHLGLHGCLPSRALVGVAVVNYCICVTRAPALMDWRLRCSGIGIALAILRFGLTKLLHPSQWPSGE